MFVVARLGAAANVKLAAAISRQRKGERIMLGDKNDCGTSSQA
jgi:hypothetical protein